VSDASSTPLSPTGSPNGASGAQDPASALQDLDADRLQRLSERAGGMNRLLDALEALDDDELERLADGAAPARPRRSPDPPPVDADFYDVFEGLTDAQREARQKTQAFMEETVRPVANEVWTTEAFPVDALAPPTADYYDDVIGVGNFSFPPDDPVRNGIVAYEMSRVDPSFCTFYEVHLSLAMGSVAMYGSEEQKERFLRPMERLEKIGSWALTEPDHGSDASGGLATTARREGDTWVLSGQKKWPGNATFADVTVVWARDTDDGQIKGFLVEPDMDGHAVEKIDGKIAKRGVENGLVTLDDVRVPEKNRLPGATSFKDVGRQLSTCRASVAWEAAGLATGAYEKALAYCNEREQFGRPVSSFQMVQDQLVTMLGKVTALQAFVMQLARVEEAEGGIDPERASLAKVWACDTMREVVQTARGVMGGNGILLEHDVARLFADAEGVFAYEGSREMNALIVGRAITGQSAFV
jgi:glutaryl-CoA dehydrogenase